MWRLHPVDVAGMDVDDAALPQAPPPEEATGSGDLEVEGELEEAQAAAVRNRVRAAFASALAGAPEDAAELGTGKPFPGSTKKPLGLAKRPLSLTKSTRPPRPGPLRPLVQTRA